MRTMQRVSTEVELSADELRRLGRWYQSYVAERDVTLAPRDVVLATKLREAHAALAECNDAVRHAARNTLSRQQYSGPERRAVLRGARPRICRPATTLLATH
jgi:hypothetical protein